MGDEEKERFKVAGDLLRRVVSDALELRKKADRIAKPADLKQLALPETRAALRDARRTVRDRIEDLRSRRLAELDERADLLERAVEIRRKTVERTPELRKEELERPEEDKFVLTGRVIDEETGKGLPGVKVRAIDMDRKYDDLVGEARTDELGYYRVVYDKSDFEDKDLQPEMYIELVDEKDEVFYTSPRGFRHKSGRVEVLNAAVGADKVPASRERSKRLSTLLDARHTELDARARTLRHLADLKRNRPEKNR